MSKITNDGLTR